MRIKKIMCKKHGTDPPDREGNKESLVAMVTKKSRRTFYNVDDFISDSQVMCIRYKL